MFEDIKSSNTLTLMKPKTIDLLVSSLKHQSFNLLQIEHLLSIINEIDAMTKDTLIQAVIKNGKERYQLDNLIFTRNLFTKD